MARLLPERPTSERCLEAYYLQRTRFERVAERKLQCKGHKIMCTDWEMRQSYRSWRYTYGSRWEQKFREKYEREMIQERDTYFYVGTMHQHPNRWIIFGLFYPPRPATPDLFDR